MINRFLNCSMATSSSLRRQRGAFSLQRSLTRCQWFSRHARTPRVSLSSRALFPITTTSRPRKSSWFRRKLSRMSLFARLRSTALRICLRAMARPRRADARPLGARQHGERFPAGSLRLLEDAFEVAGSQQAHGPLEAGAPRLVHQWFRTPASSRKAGSTFRAPRFDYFATSLCRHARAKAVAPLTLQPAGLIWSLHRATPVAPFGESSANKFATRKRG